MGRIKQTYLKRVAENLMEAYPDEFNTDFENNKKKVTEFAVIQSKSIRNKIAGYLSRVMKQKSVSVD
ncbi:MAG: 30S ribosomal protein S17e [Candidatus Altiarchaeota archaeon]|nr:30S ribosomal protein S17e [Candidatus Altiarchaeota archaeon]